MKYSFREADLPSTFCNERYKDIMHLIETVPYFSLIGMPAVGLSLFLKFLISQNKYYFVDVDMFSLAKLDRHDFYSLLLKELGGKKISSNDQEILDACKKRLIALTKKHGKVVIIFHRFDQLIHEFDQAFFGNFRTLRHVAEDQITMIFSVTKPFDIIAPKAITGGNLTMFSEYYYFKPYSESDIKRLLALHAPEASLTDPWVKRCIALSGGHFQLLQVILKSRRKENLLLDPFIRLMVKELYEYLNYKQKVIARSIAAGKKSQGDDLLVQIGMIEKKDDGYQLFSPLLNQYALSASQNNLPIKERKLLDLLKKKRGEVVQKDEIFDVIWRHEPDKASDWALNALIYRLRQNPTFKRSGFIIESHKKQGYTLLKD